MTIKKPLNYAVWIMMPVVIGFSSFYFLSETAEIAPVASPPSTEQPKISLSLLFVGDIMLDRDVKASVIKNADNDFSFLFEKADFLKDANITFGNLEGPVSDIGQDMGNIYSFRMDPKVVVSLEEAGFDALSIANNHTGDWGIDAFEDTKRRLKNEDIISIDTELKIIEKNGVKIGFLGFNDVGSTWSNFSVNEAFGRSIRKGSENADILIISFHFGDEYQEKHNQRQEELAHLAIDNGAKIVIGHHPHVIQDTEFYKDGVIAYSLGNFIFDQIFSPETMEGMVLKVVVDENGKIKTVSKNKIKINQFYQPELEE